MTKAKKTTRRSPAEIRAEIAEVEAELAARKARFPGFTREGEALAAAVAAVRRAVDDLGTFLDAHPHDCRCPVCDHGRDDHGAETGIVPTLRGLWVTAYHLLDLVESMRAGPYSTAAENARLNARIDAERPG